MKMIRRRPLAELCIVLSILLFVGPSRVLGWGGEGHQIIALVAEKHLNNQARAGIRDLLGDGVNISDAEVASWADQIRRERRNTAPWHFVDIPIDASGFDEARDGNQGNNIVDRIEHFRSVLADRTAPHGERAEALKFIVHFVGDVHQPLHCAERNGDKGGNGRLVFYVERQKAVNLHTVWDSLLLRGYVGSTRVADYAYRLDGATTLERRAEWETDTPEQWANESHLAAREHVYKGVPADGPPPKLDRAYVAENRSVVEGQLEKSGLRLAKLLNAAFAGTPATTQAIARTSLLAMPGPNGAIRAERPARLWIVLLAVLALLGLLAVGVVLIIRRCGLR